MTQDNTHESDSSHEHEEIQPPKVFEYQLKIPKERVPVLIGKSGETKQKLEAETGITLDIDSVEGIVTLQSTDSIMLFNTRQIIYAIGRGFNPDIALKLLKIDYELETINLKDVVGNSKKHLVRLRGRLIGKNGRSREIIEEATETEISIYGKTVAIIGPVERLAIARHAIEMIIQGNQHTTVYKWLERENRKVREMELDPTSDEIDSE